MWKRELPYNFFEYKGTHAHKQFAERTKYSESELLIKSTKKGLYFFQIKHLTYLSCGLMFSFSRYFAFASLCACKKKLFVFITKLSRNKGQGPRKEFWSSILNLIWFGLGLHHGWQAGEEEKTKIWVVSGETT